jgi:integrase
MPRRADPPKLEPDRRGSATYYIYFREDGHSREHSTGETDRAAAEAYFSAWLARRGRAGGPRTPDQMRIAEVLEIYGERHGPKVQSPATMGECIDALLPFWGHLPVSAINTKLCRNYVERRREQILARRARLIEEARARAQQRRRKYVAPAPREVSGGTARRELGVLQRAIDFCVEEGDLTQGQPVELPERPPSRQRWLTRAEAAAWMRACRRKAESRHAADFIRLGLRHGARKTATLQLRFTQNMDGGWADLERGLIDFNPVGHRETKKRRPVAPMTAGTLCWLGAKRRRNLTDFVIEQRVYRRGGDGRRVLVAAEPVRDVKKALATAAREAGLDGVTAHTLCHTCPTWLLQAGVATWEVAGWVGKSEQVIRDVYGHHHPDFLRNAREAMS